MRSLNSSSGSFSSDGLSSSVYIDPSTTMTPVIKESILEKIKDDLKNDKDVSELLEIAKSVFLDYIFKEVDNPGQIIEEIKNKDKEIQELKDEIYYLKSRIQQLEDNQQKVYTYPDTCTPWYTTVSSSGVCVSDSSITFTTNG